MEHAYRINTTELSFSQKLLLDISFVDDDWIAEHLNFDEIKMLTIASFNKKLQKDRSYLRLKNSSAIQGHRLLECYFTDHEHVVYLIPNKELIIELWIEVNLLTETNFDKRGNFKISTRKLFHGYIEVQVLISSKTVTNIEIKKLRLTSMT